MGAFLIASTLRGVLEQWLTAPTESESFCDAAALAEELTARYATGVPPRRDPPLAVDQSSADFRPPI